jgi:hypothetical protein
MTKRHFTTAAADPIVPPSPHDDGGTRRYQRSVAEINAKAGRRK